MVVVVAMGPLTLYPPPPHPRILVMIIMMTMVRARERRRRRIVCGRCYQVASSSIKRIGAWKGKEGTRARRKEG